jgi:hypothetical protein
MSSSDVLKQIKIIALTLLKAIPSPPPRESIRDCVQKAASVCQKVDKCDEDKLVLELESIYTTFIGNGTKLDDHEDHIPWLSDRKSSINWDFWDRYQLYLEQEKSWSPSTLNKLDDLTDQVLSRLEDPLRKGKWDRRGVVVGQVQSGKTSNYTGLICKAVDAGYKVVIVLAGIHNSLRSQTQLRLDEGFLGRDTQVKRAYEEGIAPLGVGNIRLNNKKLIVHSATSSEEKGDFNNRVANQLGLIPGGHDPILMVVKKNKSVLTNLVKWALSTVTEQAGKRVMRDVPLLVIDDEADHASINTKLMLDENGKSVDDDNVTAINGLIRKLLNGFEQSAYIGYTATPFANIFIYPNSLSDKHGTDLFPRSFIINLPAPSNYIGPAQVFGLEAEPAIDLEEVRGLDIIREINDQTEWMPVNHKKGHKPPYLPASLKEAIRAFILTCAVRIIRGQESSHNSMLIHVTRYQDVQKKVISLVKEELTSLQRRLRYGEGNAPDLVLVEFEILWQRDFEPTTESVSQVQPHYAMQQLSWDEVKSSLYHAVSRIQVKEINGSAKDILDYFEYKNGLNVIAVGGDKLSRGLTLEGLSVSYFLRASKMYDTLMQMGRWFGYRPGYLDLCRLYTTDELIDWYSHITSASEELKLEFDHMAEIGATPQDYGIKVRTHPQGLLITGVNKMRAGTEMELSYAGSLSETTIFYKDREVNWDNFQATENLLLPLDKPSESTKNFIWTGTSAEKILEFLSAYKSHEGCKPANTQILSEYIRAQIPLGELTSWTIALISSKSATHFYPIANNQVGLTRRSDASSTSVLEYRLSKSHILSPTDEWIDLPDQVKEQIREETRREREKKGKTSSSNTPSGPILRSKRSPNQALIILYPLDPNNIGLDWDFPIIGFVISFPSSTTAKRIKYKVNNVYWEQEFGEL